MEDVSGQRRRAAVPPWCRHGAAMVPPCSSRLSSRPASHNVQGVPESGRRPGGDGGPARIGRPTRSGPAGLPITNGPWSSSGFAAAGGRTRQGEEKPVAGRGRRARRHTHTHVLTHAHTRIRPHAESQVAAPQRSERQGSNSKTRQNPLSGAAGRQSG